jgi:hypothetical protein
MPGQDEENQEHPVVVDIQTSRLPHTAKSLRVRKTCSVTHSQLLLLLLLLLL